MAKYHRYADERQMIKGLNLRLYIQRLIMYAVSLSQKMFFLKTPWLFLHPRKSLRHADSGHPKSIIEREAD